MLACPAAGSAGSPNNPPRPRLPASVPFLSLFSIHRFFSHLVLAQPETVVLDIDYLAGVQRSVPDGGWNHWVDEQCLPVAKALIGKTISV